jgi:HSP20 family molecular chaperone IbpA
MDPIVMTPGAYLRHSLLADNQRGLSSPRYEITDDDKMFQVAVDIPGVDAKDVHVSLEENGKVLTLRGERQSKSDGYEFSSKFYQSFSLDPAVDTEKFSASLQNGVLVVSAPKDMKRLEGNIKTIPVIEGEPANVLVASSNDNNPEKQSPPAALIDVEQADKTNEESVTDELR